MAEHEAPKTILAMGATGRFGSIVHLLLERGYAVRAMTRDPRRPAARALREMGAVIVAGDFDDRASVEAAARGVDVAFATGTAHHVGPEGELRHGRSVAEGVAGASVAHLVYVSGDGAAPDSPLPLFRAKFEVEQRIEELHVPHTILAPVYLMENLFNPWNVPALRDGILPSPIPVEWPLQQVATADVVSLAVESIERASSSAARRIPVASDEVTAEQAAAAIARASGRPFEARPQARDALPPTLRALFGWLEERGSAVDLEELRRSYPVISWHSYQDWAHTQKDRLREVTAGPVQAR